jgi:inorganic pyrophosphatase
MRLDRLPARTEGGFHVVVESPRGSTLKLKLDPELGCVVVSRPLPLGFVYPFDWGFVPSTRAPDGDPVDALVYWDVASFPGVVVRCRALGVLELEQDDGEGGRARNDRLLAIPLVHPRGGELRTVADVAERIREELALFFTSAVFFEPKNPKVLGWKGPQAAEALLGK